MQLHNIKICKKKGHSESAQIKEKSTERLMTHRFFSYGHDLAGAIHCVWTIAEEEILVVSEVQNSIIFPMELFMIITGDREINCN